ncbi:hypothetical protein AX16_009797 [Volvariella volvacea WC 439]|nr:hypothetical protein AX16_009797 [Volvariella volvacea WC 439]
MKNRDSAAQSPVAALAYAVQSRNQAFFNHVAPLVVQSNVLFHEVLLSLPQALWAEWFFYNKKWNATFRTAINAFPMYKGTQTGSSAPISILTSCYSCGRSLYYSQNLIELPQLQVLKKLSSAGPFTNLKTTDDYLEQLEKRTCGECSHSFVPSELQTWRNGLHQAVQEIPPPLLAPELQEPKPVTTVIQVSSLFNFDDSDITIRSEDGIEFRLHKKHLEVCCGAFPPSSHPTMNEAVCLTESSSTLEMLFLFIYSRQQPDWDEFEFAKLQPFAEAVEKYQVHMATPLCKILMGRFIQSHPVGVFAYATKHGYNNLADKTAIPLLKSNTDAEDLVPLLTLNTVISWARYLEHIWAICNKAISTFPDCISPAAPGPQYCSSCQNRYGYRNADVSTAFSELSDSLSSLLKKLVDSPEGVSKFDTLSQQLDSHIDKLSPESSEAIKKWREEINKDVQNIPAFREFL